MFTQEIERSARLGAGGFARLRVGDHAAELAAQGERRKLFLATLVTLPCELGVVDSSDFGAYVLEDILTRHDATSSQCNSVRTGSTRTRQAPHNGALFGHTRATLTDQNAYASPQRIGLFETCEWFGLRPDNVHVETSERATAIRYNK